MYVTDRFTFLEESECTSRTNEMDSRTNIADPAASWTTVLWKKNNPYICFMINKTEYHIELHHMFSKKQPLSCAATYNSLLY